MPPINVSIDILWNAANKYESSFISGSALGLVTAGVIQQKPKSLAVASWQKSIWEEYYRLKDIIKAGGKVTPDFKQFGPIPHTVPELMEEIFGGS